MTSPEQSTPSPLLSIRNVCKSFSGVTVLQGISFDLLPGEVHVLAGENGAGKSTLMKILGGVYPDYDGELVMDGKPVHFRSPQAASAAGVAVIHQELSIIGEMSVTDNLFLGRELGRAGFVNKRKQNQLTREALLPLGIAVDVNRRANDYPIAVRQLMEIAKALMVNARILVMDEPTSALADPEVERLMAMIRKLKADGCCIVYISHKMQEIYQVADRITVLRDGRHICTEPAASLSQDELVRRMVGREVGQLESRKEIPPSSEERKIMVSGFSIRSAENPGAWHVRNVSFYARKGEVVGFAGLQGAGNSELLNGLFGVYGRRARGGVSLDGQPRKITGPRAAIRRGMALLTNDRKVTGIIPEMSLSRNMTLVNIREYSGGGFMRPGRETACARRHIQALGIRTSGPAQEIRFLSGGNQQKVLLARWLETSPGILLLDEPTKGVDVGAKQEIYELIYRLRDAGATILLVTTEMPELLALSDRIYVMHRGEVTAEYLRSEATQEKVLAAAMGESDQGASS